MSGLGLRVLCTDPSVHADAVALLRQEGFEVAFADAARPQGPLLDALRRHAPVHAMILRGLPQIDAAALDAAPEVRILSCHGAGFDTVDVPLATARGIVVTTSGGANAPAVAEHAFAMIVALARRLPQLDAQVRRGEWASRGYLGREFSEIVLGIVGFGNIGRRTAELARAVGMQVIVHTRTAGSVDPALGEQVASLEALAERADVISLHAPLTDATRRMIDRALIARMKCGAMLVNTARGGLVDELALAGALASGRLGAAALDALDPEPPEWGSPVLDAPNTLISPHIAALTAPSMARMGAVAAQNIVRFFAGAPLDPKLVVNPQALGSNPE